MTERRKWLFLVALLSLFALVGAACAGDEEAPPGGDGGDDATAACDADEFGCVEVGAGEPVKIGTLLVITTANAALGQDSQNGVVLAADFRDGTFDGTLGQVAGHPIEFNHQDDLCSAEGGQAGAQALAADEDVVAVIGTSCSSAALGVADTILSDQGIVLISSSNTGPALTAPETHQPFYLRTAHNDTIQGAVVANFAFKELGAASATTIHDGSPYADGLQQAFADVFVELGGEIKSQEAVQVGDTDFKPLLTDIAADAPDVLYFPIFVAEGGLITQQARETAGLEDTDLIGSDGMFTPDWIDAAGPENANGVYISGPDVTALGGDVDLYNNEFLPAYSEQFGEEPQAAFHAHAFDAMNMVLDAIEEVAIETTDGGLAIPRTALKDALFATTGFEGITGTLDCNENGDCQPSATIGVFVVEDGAFSESPVFSETGTLEE
jgi:branched-chain amino acid transport system substrate-binding protein